MSSRSLRERAGQWIESTAVQKFIIVLIVINAVILGMQTSPSLEESIGVQLNLADQAILAVFVFEIAVKLYAFGLGFFKRAWNNFDFIIVGIALVPASGPLAVLRALRVLRVLRMISMVPRLRFVVEALLHAIPGISSIAALMLLIFYVFAVMATSIFGEAFPEWFGNIGASMYTLFQVMTLESWSMGIVRPVMEVYPYAWLYFVPFILIATFTMLNLFIAIIVDTMQTMHSADHEEDREHIEETVHQDTDALGEELRSLREEIAMLRNELRQRV
ncbi:MAG: ion transporter [Chromatiales bacterium]|nr:ion transporter [Chromatiales bacterium]